MMPEGLVKISSALYETIMPMVKAQVERFAQRSNCAQIDH